MAQTALITFAKAPVPGTVKTRLIPALGAEGAASLYRKLCDHALANAADSGLPLVLACAPDVSHPYLTELATRHQAALEVQEGADLGARMAHALTRALDSHDASLLIGTDCPALDGAAIKHAAAQLQAHDAVFVPTEDGGYALVGVHARVPNRESVFAAMFDDMPWSTQQVMSITLARLDAMSVRYTLSPTLWDVDEPADLPRLRALLPGALDTTHTA
jgi:uncharacterized protein